MIIRLLNTTLREYILIYLKSHLSYEQLHIYDNGSAQPNLAAKDVAKYLIPLPPIEEQKRIVAAIEKIMPLIEEYGKKETELKAFNEQISTFIKKAILQEAVQGKLVPQIISEGNAKDLLEEIKKEKAKLIKEGKIKKEKILPEITEDEIPFDIPESWCWCRLGEIGDWKAGSTPSRSNPELYNGNIPWLKTGDLTDGDINEIPECISKKALESCSMRLNPIGSVLIAMYGATIGKLGILKIEATTNQACCACVPYNGIYNKYLFYYLMSQKKDFTEKAEGGAQPNISREKLVVHLLPLPPYEEQKRIVAAIVKMLSLCEKLGE
jgi:type I restriction enzyme S subunit